MRREHSPPKDRTAGDGPAFRVLRHRDYRLLWSCQIVSTLGTEIQRVAIAWQVFRLTGDPLQLGLLGLFRFAPVILFGLAGGVVADRGDRRRTLLLTQIVLLGTTAVLAALTAADRVSMPLIYALTFVSAAVNAVGQPTRQALIPALVPRAEVAGAMTLNVLGWQVAAVTGPAVGGVIIASFGVATAYAVDAVSFLAVIAALLLLRARPVLPELSVGGLAAALEGLRFLRSSPILLGVMGLDFLATFFGQSMTLMPIFADRILHAGARGLGLLYSAPAAGAVLGSLAMSVAPTLRRPGFVILIAVFAYGCCTIAFGLSQELGWALLFLAGGGAADAVSMAGRATIRNLATPDALRGRVSAAHSTFAMGGPQLGEFEAGALARVTGAGPAVVAGGIGTLVTAALVARLVPGIAAYRVGPSSADAPTGLPPTGPPLAKRPTAPAAGDR